MLTAVSQQRSEQVPLRKQAPPLGIVVMGVSGCGKTTVAATVAQHLGAGFLEADKLHPAENIAKMSSGIPLTDIDRAPWLDEVGARIADGVREHGRIIAACSALRRSYRERLKQASGLDLLFVLLEGSRETLQQRVEGRSSHFMPPALLDSQLATLEPPGEDERAFAVRITRPVEQMVEEILLSPELEGRLSPLPGDT